MFVIPPLNQIVKKTAMLTQMISTALVFLVLFVFSILSWQNAEQTLKTQREQAMNEKLTSVEDTIVQRVELNRTLLRAGAGLFEASDNTVTRDEWHRFVQQFSVDERFKGISAVGYIQVVPSNERDSFVRNIRLHDVANYTITPNGDREVYAPVLYSEHIQGNNTALGYDSYTNVTRRVAMETARDEGHATMTDPLSLSAGNKKGVIMYIPVYDQRSSPQNITDRRAELQGYVYLGMRTNDLLANIINKNDKNIGLVVSDKNNTQSSKIYSTVPSNTKMKSITSADLNTFGQIWSVSLVGDGGIMPTGDDSRPSTILAGGIAISFITSVAVYLLIQFRTRSFALAEEHRLQQAKDELLSLASHQLRTPATGVKQYIGMVLDGFAGKVSKRQVELLQQAYKSNERQLQIINEFLYVAKLGSGSLTTAEHRFDLAPLVRDVVSEMKGDIEEKQHDVVVTAPKRLMTRADEHSVRMIVENLISNAVKYTHAKGEISVELKRTGPEARVVVRDNGIGIARKDMQMLFKQFSRIPNEMSSDVSGSGIGLYLAQQLAARNGGLITVESEQGKGSSFILHLPIKTVKNITKTPDEA